MSDNYDELKAALEWNGKSTPGLKATRRFALWHLGDRTWADRILHAYLNPEQTMENLKAEQDG